MNSLYDEFRSSPYYVDDPSKACLFVAFLELGDDIYKLSEWNQNGRNHLLLIDQEINMVDTEKFGAAVIVAENITNYRQNMDIELFMNVDKEFTSDWAKLPSILPYNTKV